MSSSLIHFSITRPNVVFTLIGTIALIFAALIFKIQIDTDPENMLPEREMARLYHNEVKREFSLNDIIVVGAIVKEAESIFNPQSLSELKQLSDNILQIDGVVKKDVNSLATIDNISQTETGSIRFEWMMAKAPKTEAQAQQLKVSANRLPFVVNSLVSADGKAATIYVPIKDKNESYRISTEIQAMTQSFSTANDYHITGLPVAEDTFGVEMFIQMGISAPAAAIVIYLLMLYFFRSASLVAAPMIVAMSTVIIVMGAMIGMGYTVHIMSSMIPIFLMPIAVVDSVHLMSEFTDHFKSGQEPKQSIAQVTRNLFRPMLFTSVTSSVGFFSLSLTPIPPVQTFGIFVGCGILLAFLITLIVIPAYISKMSPASLAVMQRKLHQGERPKSKIAEALPQWGQFSIKRFRLILMFTAVVVGLSIAGINKIEINDNPVRWFKPSHPIRVADKLLNHHFAGTYDAQLVLEFENATALAEEWRKIIVDDLERLDISRDSKNALEDYFKKQTQDVSMQEFVLLVDDLLFDEDGAGQDNLSSLIEVTDTYMQRRNFFKQPESLRYIEKLENFLASTDLVGKSNSLVDLVKTVNRELISGKDKDYAIPSTQTAVAQTLLQYQSSHRPHDLWHFVTPDYSKTLIWLQLTSGDNKDMQAVVDAVSQYLIEHPLPHGVSMKWAGKAYLNLIWQDKMVAGMLDSLLSAFVIVFLMMVLLFRSFLFGLLAMLPLSITILFMYGMIGWTGKYYDMPIAVLSALTLGLSVDFAIHFIERTRAIFLKTQSWHQTMEQMFNEPARAITRNALVIAIGFTPLLLAPLVPYITVGAFLAIIMMVSAVVTLLILPAVMQMMKKILFK